MTEDGMMPGQEPYTPEERERLYALVRDAADGDPGEQGEPRVSTALAPGRPGQRRNEMENGKDRRAQARKAAADVRKHIAASMALLDAGLDSAACREAEAAYGAAFDLTAIVAGDLDHYDPAANAPVPEASLLAASARSVGGGT